MSGVLIAATGGAGAITGSLKEDSALSLNPVDNYLRSPLVLETSKSTLSLGSVAEGSPTATAESGASATATPVQPQFYAYTVKPGDTVSGIASAYGIKTEYILLNNPEVGYHPDSLVPGQTVLVPSTNGIIYTLQLGDTVSGVAAYFGVSVADIVASAANGLASADTVAEGQTLLVPGGTLPAPPLAPPPLPAYVAPPQPGFDPPPVVSSGAGFSWPFYGNISQSFGGGHAGIDIDGFGRHGAPVVAAAGGQVILASYGGYGYGYHVIISHGGGFTTLYAHLSDIYVSQGEYVSAGETIGAVGCTGYCTGTHLHFEIRINGAPVNPLNYL